MQPLGLLARPEDDFEAKVRHTDPTPTHRTHINTQTQHQHTEHTSTRRPDNNTQNTHQQAEQAPHKHVWSDPAQTDAPIQTPTRHDQMVRQSDSQYTEDNSHQSLSSISCSFGSQSSGVGGCAASSAIDWQERDQVPMEAKHSGYSPPGYAMLCCAVLCGALFCGAVLCGALWCGAVLCGALFCGAVLCRAL